MNNPSAGEARDTQWTVEEWREIVESQANSETFFVCFEDCIEMLDAYDKALIDRDRLACEVEELMKVDYWQDRYNIVVKERDELAG